MKKLFIKWRWLLLFILVLFLGAYRLLGYLEEKKVELAITKVRQEIKLKPSDKLTGCMTSDKKYTFVQINRDLLLADDGKNLVIPEQGLKQTNRVKQIAPELPVLTIKYDPYAVAENCYLE